MHMTRCLGVILLNPTTNKVTMMDNLKDRFQKWKITHVNDLTGEQMVAFRKFGHKVMFYFFLNNSFRDHPLRTFAIWRGQISLKFAYRVLKNRRQGLKIS